MTASNEARATTASNETKQGASLLEINALVPTSSKYLYVFKDFARGVVWPIVASLVLLNGFLTKKFIVSNMLSSTIL
jgi:hypothetical protein